MAKARPLGPQSATQNRVRPWAPQRHTPGGRGAASTQMLHTPAPGRTLLCRPPRWL